MKNPTFLEQYNKIVNAYLKNELNPMKPCGCFVGNLLNNSREWSLSSIEECVKKEANGFYTVEEIEKLEREFMFGDMNDGRWFSIQGKILDEEALYKSMERTLLMLKEIHESKGEIVESYTFSKRQLQTL